MDSQNKLRKDEEKDEFVESLNLTPKKIKEDMEKMKEIEGFPKGDDDDILNLSNPPYYTAYPNPYIKAFIEKFGKKYDEKTDDYDREPYVFDLKENKNDNIYSAHSYHTKVPPEGIRKLIEHYTNTGDLILDVFCGSGMTGIAAQDSKRRFIICDLSPMAAFISTNYCTLFAKFSNEITEIFNRILAKTEKEYGAFYEYESEIINYIVWSDIYVCPHCKKEIIFYKNETKKNTLKCPSCTAESTIKSMERALTNGKFAPSPVFLNKGRGKDRETVEDTDFLLHQEKELDSFNIPYWYPNQKANFKYKKWGKLENQNHSGIKDISDFYFKRTLIILSFIYNEIEKIPSKDLKTKCKFIFTAGIVRLTILNRFILQYNTNVGPLSSTLYIPPLFAEMNPISNFKAKTKEIAKICSKGYGDFGIVGTQSSTDLQNLPDASIDYIFIDPPFGENIMYSGSNYVWEVWLKVITNTSKEAIINEFQNKDINEYHNLLYDSLREMFRILKPNRWITIEFSNSKAEVWNKIRESVVKAGFIIAQINVLDKQKGSIYQASRVGSIKQDLVINAYKPRDSFRKRFILNRGNNMEFDFIRQHLDHLPVEPNSERDSQRLYNKLIMYYIQNSFDIRLNFDEFRDSLKKNFNERDSYWFNGNQINEYEKRKRISEKVTSGSSLYNFFIIDEDSAIQWIYSFLEKPKSYSEIHEKYLQSLQEECKDLMPELSQVLQENFIMEDGKYRRPSLNEKKEREDMRIKRLMREFQDIIASAASGNKITEVRKDALLAGLMKLYNEKNVDQIKLIGKKLDKKIIESDDDINAIVDWAMAKGD